MDNTSNRNALIRAALMLFRRRGYAGVGVSDILSATGLPKGSLYYYFPGGKQQLAEEAVRWADKAITNTIESSFGDATSFADGAVALCCAIARLAADETRLSGCPVLSVIQAGEDKPALRVTGAEVLAGWTQRIAVHAQRFGLEAPDMAAALLVMQLEGAWVVATAQQSAAPFDILEGHLASQAPRAQVPRPANEDRPA